MRSADMGVLRKRGRQRMLPQQPKSESKVEVHQLFSGRWTGSTVPVDSAHGGLGGQRCGLSSVRSVISETTQINRLIAMKITDLQLSSWAWNSNLSRNVHVLVLRCGYSYRKRNRNRHDNYCRWRLKTTTRLSTLPALLVVKVKKLRRRNDPRDSKMYGKTFDLNDPREIGQSERQRYCGEIFNYLRLRSANKRHELIPTKNLSGMVGKGRDIHEYETRGRDNYRSGMHRTVVYEHLPSQAGVHFINRLPNKIKNASTPKVLKTRIKLCLASNAFYSVDEFLAFNWETTR
ncbi:hypothetical protein J6590_075058 [Homalodisca vitripennis]|nr:hypothetical protein J6590_075058 [Homalodisca vitripennis]